MILSSCHHHSLNNDSHCCWHCCCHCHYMQRIYVYFILSCLLLSSLVLSCLVLSWVDEYYYCYYRHDVVWSRLTLHYHIISYHIISHVLLFYLFCWFDLHSTLFYLILFNSTLFQIDLIWFFSLLLNSIYYIVQYSISYQWMICVYLSVRLSVCLFVYLYE